MEKRSESIQELLDFIGYVKMTKPYFKSMKIDEMAKELKYNRKKLKKMLKLMQTLETAKIGAVLDYRKLGLDTYILEIKPKKAGNAFKVLELLSDFEGVFSAYLISSDCLTIKVKFKVKPKNLEKMLYALEKHLRGYTEPIVTIPVWKTYVEQCIPVTEKMPNKILKVDERDWEMLKMLVRNSQVKLRDISKKLKISEPSVYSRLKRIRNSGIILGYEATNIWKNVPKGQFNPKLMRTMISAKIDPKEIPKVIKWILDSKYAPGIRSAYETYGDENFSFSMVTGKVFELERFIEELTKKFNFRKLDVGVMLGMKWKHHALGYEFVKP